MRSSSASNWRRWSSVMFSAARSAAKPNTSARAHQLYDSYVKELHLYRRQNFNTPGNMRRSNIEHRRIYEAIAKGNSARAKAAAEEHINAGRQRLLASADET